MPSKPIKQWIREILDIAPLASPFEIARAMSPEEVAKNMHLKYSPEEVAKAMKEMVDDGELIREYITLETSSPEITVGLESKPLEKVIKDGEKKKQKGKADST